jgi:hypothetical protein
VTAEVSNCITHHNGMHGVHAYYECKDYHIHHCTSYNNGWYHEATGGHGISSWSNSDSYYPHDGIIEHNTCYNTYRSYWGGSWKEGTGIQADGRTHNNTYRYNICYDNEGPGFYDNGQGTNQATSDWYYNISYGNGTYQAENVTAGFVCNNPNGATFYNNVSYDNTNCGFAQEGTISSGPILRNNIFAENAAREIHMVPGATTMDSDYNCIYHSAGGSFMKYNGSNYTFSGWQTETGDDAHSTDSDPDFVDAANADFKLNSASPCIDVGADVSLTEDYDGNTVPTGGGVEIGAYEYIPSASGTIAAASSASASGGFFIGGAGTVAATTALTAVGLSATELNAKATITATSSVTIGSAVLKAAGAIVGVSATIAAAATAYPSDILVLERIRDWPYPNMDLFFMG